MCFFSAYNVSIRRFKTPSTVYMSAYLIFRSGLGADLTIINCPTDSALDKTPVNKPVPKTTFHGAEDIWESNTI